MYRARVDSLASVFSSGVLFFASPSALLLVAVERVCLMFFLGMLVGEKSTIIVETGRIFLPHPFDFNIHFNVRFGRKPLVFSAIVRWKKQRSFQ